MKIIDCVQGEEFTKNPLVKVEVIRCRLILAVQYRIFVLYRPLERVVGSRASIPFGNRIVAFIRASTTESLKRVDISCL